MTLPPPTWSSDLCIAIASPTHGIGVFASVDLKNNQKICDYIGDELTLKQFKELYGDDTRYTYSMKRINKVLSAKKYLTSNLPNYINESLTPNVILKKRALYTLHPISAGQELFLRYPTNYPRDYVLN